MYARWIPAFAVRYYRSRFMHSQAIVAAVLAVRIDLVKIHLVHLKNL